MTTDPAATASPKTQAKTDPSYDPNLPIETSMRDEIQLMFKVSLPVAQYIRTHEIISTEGTKILHIGCGSGVETLLMAEANPGARIVAIDTVAEPIRVAQKRLRYHGFHAVEFHLLDLRDLGQIDQTFDFINCTNLLHSQSSPLPILQAIASLLKPQGVLRASLPSYYARIFTHHWQDVFAALGINPTKLNQESLQEYLDQLDPNSWLTISNSNKNSPLEKEILLEEILSGNKGYSISDVFNLLAEANLDFISFVNAHSWDLVAAFQSTPQVLMEKTHDLQRIQRLHLFELLYPNRHKTIDFWAEHRGSSLVFPWTDHDWQGGIIQLNPLLMNSLKFQDAFKKGVLYPHPFVLNQWAGVAQESLVITHEQAQWLGALLAGPMSVRQVIEKAITLDPSAPESTTETVLAILKALEEALFILLEPISADQL
jgi:ubiquinone/menaquinone biosynthesis C-methylase UbiE